MEKIIFTAVVFLQILTGELFWFCLTHLVHQVSSVTQSFLTSSHSLLCSVTPVHFVPFPLWSGFEVLVWYLVFGI